MVQYFFQDNVDLEVPRAEWPNRPYLCDTEDDEDVAEGGEDREEDEGEAPVVGRQSRCCGIEAGEEEEGKTKLLMVQI